MVAVCFMAQLCAMPASAQDSVQEQSEEPSPWTLGVALGHGKRINPFVGSDDTRLNAVLDLAWYGERFFFDNGDFGFTLSDSDQLSVSALLVFNNERNYYSSLNNGSSGLDIFNLKRLAQDKGIGLPGIAGGDDLDLDSLSGAELEKIVFKDIDSSLPQRDFAASGGLEFLYSNTWGDWQGQILSDVSAVHAGQSAWVAYSYPWYTRNSEFKLSMGLEFKSAQLVDYYYGVRPSERLEGRPTYSAGSGTNRVVRLSATHKLSERWRLVGVMEREYLGAAIRKSPIIERGTVDTIFVGIYYQFK